MVTIAIHFLAGRYHSTPWGSHVNEGVVEWPPNPWRLLRALVATGFSKLQWDDIPDEARQLILKLGDTLPEFHLPRGEVAHTRHYMPNGNFHPKQKNLEATDKVLDTFVRLRPEEPLLVRWQVELTRGEKALLAQLVEQLSYFGRAESWCDAFVNDRPIPSDGWSKPCVKGGHIEHGGDQVSLLACRPSAEYAQWRDAAVRSAFEEEEIKRGKRLTKSQAERVSASFPIDLLACLTNETGILQKQGWNQPPGSRRVLYHRPPGTLTPRPVRRHRAKRVPTREAALLALSSDSVRGNRLPLLARAVRQTEFIHQALVSILNKQLHARDCSSLTGRDERGRKLEHGHQHAHYLPLDLDGDWRIDHVIVYAPAGLDARAQQAITRLRRTWTKGQDTDIFVTCAGFADLNLFRRQLTDAVGRPLSVIPLQPAREWDSYTPYVPARHLKPKNNRYTLADDIRRELRLRGLPTPSVVQSFSELGRKGKLALVDRRFFTYARTRIDRKPQPPRPNVHGVRVVFDEPQFGPIALGYGSHFGLGVFKAEQFSMC